MFGAISLLFDSPGSHHEKDVFLLGHVLLGLSARLLSLAYLIFDVAGGSAALCEICRNSKCSQQRARVDSGLRPCNEDGLIVETSPPATEMKSSS